MADGSLHAPRFFGAPLAMCAVDPWGLFGEVSGRYVCVVLWASSTVRGRIAGWILGTERASPLPPPCKMDHLLLLMQGDQTLLLYPSFPTADPPKRGVHVYRFFSRIYRLTGYVGF